MIAPVPRLSLHFSTQPVQLERTEFLVSDGDPLVSERTKDRGAYPESGSFEWRSGVKAMSILLLRSAAFALRGETSSTAVLEGAVKSPANSLGSVLVEHLEKMPRWPKDMFGPRQASARPRVLDLISHTNAGRKRKNAPNSPVVLAINPHLLPPGNIHVYLGRSRVQDPSMLGRMADEIERSERAWQQPIEPISQTPTTEPGAIPLDHAALPMGLVDHFCSFDTYIADRVRGFAGRNFVFDDLNSFLKATESRCGYFLIRGDPGIGKTACLAEWVRRNQVSLHHFNITQQGINTFGRFVGNLAARLVAAGLLKYQLLPDGFDRDGAFLNRMLEESCRKLNSGQRLIIGVDALDEVESQTGSLANPLFLPAALPDGAFMVLTMRRRERQIPQLSGLHVLDFNEYAQQNAADAEEYIITRLQAAACRRWLNATKNSGADFAKILLDRSRANFMYLRHVLDAIERGTFKSFDSHSLPEGLRAYYRGHWKQMQKGRTADQAEAMERVVCALGAAKASVSGAKLSLWTDVAPRLVHSILRDWAEFLHVERTGKGSERYSLYHVAFRDFLTEEIDPNLRRSHKMIAKHQIAPIDQMLEGLDRVDDTTATRRPVSRIRTKASRGVRPTGRTRSRQRRR